MLLFQISSVACLACLCSSGTVKVGLFMLPLIGRLRLMMFVTVFSLLVTCLFIFLDISHIVYFFPFNWGKLVSGMVLSCWLVHLLHELLVLCDVVCNHDSVKGLAMDWMAGFYFSIGHLSRHCLCAQHGSLSYLTYPLCTRGSFCLSSHAEWLFSIFRLMFSNVQDPLLSTYVFVACLGSSVHLIPCVPWALSPRMK